MNDFTTPISQHKAKAEQLFCASVLSMQENVLHDCQWLQPELFSTPRYKKFWQDVLEGKPASQAAIDGKLLGELSTALGFMVSSMEYESYAQTIADDAYLLSIAEHVSPLSRAIAERDQDEVKRHIQSIGEKMPSGIDEIPSAIDIAMEFAETIGLDNKTIKTYVPSLDSAIGGYKYGTLNLIAARTSMGKSTIAFQIARNWAANGKKVLYFTPEMTRNELWARAACGLLEMPLKKYLISDLTKQEESQLVQVSADLMNVYEDRLLIQDNSRLTSEDIWKAVARYRPDAIVVDHISLLSDKADSEIKRLGNITWAGKQIAKTYNLVSVYLQQLNRNTEQQNRKDRRPTMADLRDSGETEQNADTVTFLYRPDYYEIGEPKLVSDTELIIAKNRNGERNVVAKTKYHMMRQWFYTAKELEQESEIRRTR